jgi:ceramide glucosyltransferase
MIHPIIKTSEFIVVLGAVSSAGYYCLCLVASARFLWERKARSKVGRSVQTLPPVSILKPLKGTDPEMYESFRSYCLQDYPEYDIIFGVSDAADPAVAFVDRLRLEFPRIRIQCVVCRAVLGANLKVSNLAQMLPSASHKYLIVNDSDIRVGPDYLRRVIVPLLSPEVGMVTCLYRGIAGPTMGSRLESLGISTDFCPGVLAARFLEGIRFGLGSTLAFRRRDIQALGGFEAFVDYLADDYELGHQVAEKGLKIELSPVVVETYLPSYTFRQFLDHQLRWARSVRDSRRWGYLGLGLTFGLSWALLAVVLAHGAMWARQLLAAIVILRMTTALAVGLSVLGDSQVPGALWLVPLRDLIAVLVWVISFAGHTVEWRGDSFRLKDGKLVRLDTP